MTGPLWTPDPDRSAGTAIAQLAQSQGFEGENAIHKLWRWSIEHPEDFWSIVWRDCGIRASRDAEQTLKNAGQMPGAQWFPGARLNYAENLLRRQDNTPAIIFRGEDGRRIELSFKQVYDKVEALASALRQCGVTKGDRVAGYLPNIPETVIGLLATSSIGAIWSSCSPDFGVRGVVDRFGQIEPKVLITIDGYHYGGKQFSMRDKIDAVGKELTSVEHIVLVPFLDAHAEAFDGTELFDNFVSGTPEPLTFEQLPFDHPLYVLYSSGTTGKPKAIVHGAGGSLIQHMKEHRYHTDLKAGDRLFYFTTCGWMMWNWLVSALASEVTIVLFDGSPFHPKASVLWDMAAEEKLSVFGTSAKYIDALKKEGLKPRETHDLTALRAMCSTGSPLVAESFDYVYQGIKPDLQLASISGGTDIVSCFVLGNPAGPVHRGEIQMRGLGLAVDVWNDDGKPVRGEKGELVCTKPFPCMPVSFWNDPDGSRYHASYFERFPGVWAHGDFAEITEHDGIIIHGRSDAVLNPGGVRIGTAEIYRQVEQIPEILEAICIGQEWQDDVRVVLFVKMRPGQDLDDPLRDRIKKQIRTNCTPRHVPARILAVSDIPRTMSGKITEIAVRDVVHGRQVKNTEALANPKVLDEYRNRQELRD